MALHRLCVRLGALLLVALAALPGTTWAQVGMNPSPAYFAALPAYNSGNFPGALGGFQNAYRSGIQTPAGRWIDSICALTMAGECYYHMGKLDEALAQHTQALTLYASFYDWMLRVQFPATIASAGAGARAVVPWGASQRPTLPGQFPQSFLINQGSFNSANTALVQGGAIQQAVTVPMAVSEIVRCTTLSIRRRHELMGPVCKYDTLTNELITLLQRRPAPPNHWSQAWIDVELGTAQAAAGNVTAAVATLERALVIGGDMDHPLTAAALLQLGILALDAGDFVRASQYFRETTFVAATFNTQALGFNDPALMEEAFRYGQMVHLMTGQPQVNPMLGPALTWVRSRGYGYLQASLAVSLAENWALLGERPAAVTELGEAKNLVGHSPLTDSDVGARYNMVAALMGYQSGQLAAGDAPLHQALAYQQTGSLWMFQIRLVDSLYLDGLLNERVVTQLYELLLRDPTPVDWAASPLECLSVLVNPHPVAYEHWFEATMRRGKLSEQLLEIADRTRRHRYLSSLPLGGRLLGLRWMLEGPKELLNDQVLLQRQELLNKYPYYSELADDEKKRLADLLAAPVVDDAVDARREQAQRLGELSSLGEAQEVILHEIAVRREPSELIFPPLRKTEDLQKALPEGHLLLAFFATSNENLYGFLFSKDKYTTWTISSPAAVNRHLTTMLRDMGNTDHNRQISLQDLGKASWRKSAGKLIEALFDKSEVDLAAKFDELIVVPDGALWYLPFEALPVGADPQTAEPLITKVRVRYAPTVGLAIPYHHIHKPEPKPTGVVLGKLYPHDSDSVAQTAYEKLERSVTHTVVLPRNPLAPSSMTRTLLDGLIVLDDIDDLSSTCWNYAWSPMQIDSGKPGGSLANWMRLPWGGPEWVVLPGFHTPAENGLKKMPTQCNDIFTAVCGLMSTGVRTILISRWRPGGQSGFDLVREFAQELPHSPPANCWQRAVELLVEQPLDLDGEPRVKRAATGTEPPLAEHPFFWAAYMLVDSGQLEEGQAVPPPPAVNVKPKLAPPAPGDVKAKAAPFGAGNPAAAGAAAAGGAPPADGMANPTVSPKAAGKKTPARPPRKPRNQFDEMQN